MTNFLHTHCGRFWHQIHKSGRCGSFNFQPKEDIQAHQRLDWQLILWNHTRVGLQPPNGGHINAEIHHQETTQVKHNKPFKLKIVHRHPSPRNLALKHKPPSPPMTHQNLTKWASNPSKKMLEVSYITPVWWI